MGDVILEVDGQPVYGKRQVRTRARARARGLDAWEKASQGSTDVTIGEKALQGTRMHPRHGDIRVTETSESLRHPSHGEGHIRVMSTTRAYLSHFQ